MAAVSDLANMDVIYTGIHEYSFDEKGRITIPREWRRDGFPSCFVMASARKCLRVYPESWLADQKSRLKHCGAKMNDPELKRLRDMASLLSPVVELDSQARMMVKQLFRSKAGIDSKDALLVGRFDYFEIWNCQSYQSRENARIDDYDDEDGSIG